MTLYFWGSRNEAWESTTYVNAAEFVAAVAVDRDAVGVLKCKKPRYHGHAEMIPRCKLGEMTDSGVVLGDRKTIHQISKSFEQAYGKKLQLNRLGSLEELFNHMQQFRAKEPENIYSWLAQYALPTYLPRIHFWSGQR